MKITSANLNGIRSANTKGFFEWLKKESPDVLCVQELKAQGADMSLEMLQPHGYHGYFHYAEKKGYSGVGIYCKQKPDRIAIGIGHKEFDAEGRYIRADFGSMSVISVYLPSGSSGPERQEAKFRFMDEFMPILDALLTEGRQFVVCGDWNIAHKEIDLKNWKGNLKNSGFLPEERTWLTKLYSRGWVDVYRALYPDAGDSGYTWWSNRGQAYAKNVGWRIDLHVATEQIAALAQSGNIYKGQKFSDHAPLTIEYKISN